MSAMSDASDTPPDRPDPSEEWKSVTHRFAVDRHKGYVTIAIDRFDRPVHLEIRMARAGGVLRGLLDALAVSVSLGLREGVPLATYVRHFGYTRFEPSGWTERMGYAHSIVDYVFRWLGEQFPAETLPQLHDNVPVMEDGETCAVCGAPLTWEPGSPCPDCGEILPLPDTAAGQAPGAAAP